MRMIHFTDPQNAEKNYDWLRDVKENHEIMLEHCAKGRGREKNCIWHCMIEKDGDMCRCKSSNTVWGKIKRRLLAFARRERL